MPTNRSKHGRRSAGLDAAIREDIQGQQVLAAVERATHTRYVWKQLSDRFAPKRMVTLADPESAGTMLIGARLMYCGHDGWFIADVIPVGDACTVRASGPVTPSNIVRGENHLATLHMVDFPGPVAWMPDLGVFVVPARNIRILR